MGHRVVFDEISEEGITVLADWGFQGDRVAGHIQDLTNLIVGDVHGPSDFELRWFSLQDLLESVPGFFDSVDCLPDVHGKPYGAALIRNCARDRLPNPPGRVCREFEPALVVKFVSGLHEADVSLLDKVE